MEPLKTRSDLFVVDVETTGPNPFLHDPLMLALVPAEGTEEPFVVYIKTEKPRWSPYAAENFKTFEAQWKKHAREPREVVDELEAYLKTRIGSGKATLIGHNVGFDVSFLRKLAFLAGQEDIKGLSHRSVDTHTLLFAAFRAGKLPEGALTSDGAFSHFGISFESGTRHTALHDAMATRSLFHEVLNLLATDAGAAARHSSAGHS